MDKAKLAMEGNSVVARLIGNTPGLIPWQCWQIGGILNIATNVSVCTLYVGVQFGHPSANRNTLDLVILFLKEHDMIMQ